MVAQPLLRERHYQPDDIAAGVPMGFSSTTISTVFNYTQRFSS
jgi:hypothetical protein